MYFFSTHSPAKERVHIKRQWKSERRNRVRVGVSVVGLPAVSHHQLVEGGHHGSKGRSHDGKCVLVMKEWEIGDEIIHGKKSNPVTILLSRNLWQRWWNIRGIVTIVENVQVAIVKSWEKKKCKNMF